MRAAVSAAVALALVPAGARATGAAPAETAGMPAPVPGLSEDSVLRALKAAALASRPELAQARAQIAGLHERPAQASVLPDPTLAVGIQNDGFSGIEVGKMQMSWYSIVASQTLPWPGKRGLRAQVAALDVRVADADLRRAQLTVAAEVERAYVALLLVRGQRALLARLDSLWQKSELAARARYEAGEGAQAELLRAQLERSRLRRRSWSLDAEEAQRVAALDRVAGRPLDQPIATNLALADLPDPAIPDVTQAVSAALAGSPELERARLAGEQADRRVDLARRERWPDVTLSAGVMPRGGGFTTMWQAGVALNLPVWTAVKQKRAIAENQARGQAARSGVDALAQLLAERVRTRLAALRALVDANHLYRTELLVESEATVSSTLAQYQVGRLGFASVLEALAGYLLDVNGYLESVAAAQRLAIADREISLEPPGGIGAGEPTVASTPGSPATPAAGESPGGSAAMSRM
jgi:outer membrane protein TolC